MRIISGVYGGRRLKVPADQTIRPTSDKVRGAIFNALMSRIDLEDISVMDMFCGTGALGLEALSRGAASCSFIDKSAASLSLTRENCAALGVVDSTAAFTRADSCALTPDEDAAPIDLFFCDPPYKRGYIEAALENAHKKSFLSSGAVGVLESEKGWSGVLLSVFEIMHQKDYGDTRVTYVTYAGQ